MTQESYLELLQDFMKCMIQQFSYDCYHYYTCMQGYFNVSSGIDGSANLYNDLY